MLKLKIPIFKTRSQPRGAHSQTQPLLRGWANYYRNGASKRTFDKLDYCVWNQLWRWTKRRHPNKSPTWRKQRYFSKDRDCWNFSVTIRLANGESKVLNLYR